jgi:hypothetical protein
MVQVGGWNIWANKGERLRQFTVAEPSEEGAIATLEEANPGLEIISRHIVDLPLIRKLGLPGGKIMEWVPIDPKDKITRAGGVPIDKPMGNKRS